MKSVRCILTYFHFANEQGIDHKSSLEPRTLAWYYWPCYPNCIIPVVWTQGFPSNLKKKTRISKQNSMWCMSIACYQQNKLIAATSVCFLVIPDFLRYSLCIKQTRSPSHLNKIKTYLSSRRASSCTSMFPPPVPSTSYLAPPPPPYHISVKLGIQDGHSDTEFFSLLFSIFHIIHKIAIATSYSLQ